MKASNRIIDMYLDYTNNFLTVRNFAEYHNLTENQAMKVIELGRDLFNQSLK